MQANYTVKYGVLYGMFDSMDFFDFQINDEILSIS